MNNEYDFKGKRFAPYSDETSGVGGKYRPTTYGVYDNEKGCIHRLSSAKNMEEARQQAIELNENPPVDMAPIIETEQKETSNTEKMTLVGNIAGYNFFIGVDKHGKKWYNIHPQEQGVDFPVAGYASPDWIATIKNVAWPDRFVLPEFYQSWTREQFTQMEKAIVKHLRYQRRTYETGNGRQQVQFKGWDHITEIIGLAYTSSSAYAGYFVTNVTLRHPNYPGYRYFSFAIGHDNKCYAILWDIKENELIIQL